MSATFPEITSTTALVVVDVQNGFVNENSAVAIPQIDSLIQHWQSANAPIYFTKFLNLPGSNWESLVGWTRLRSAPETDFHESVEPFVAQGVVVEKPNLYTSITGRLAEDVHGGKLTDLVICGIATESCVLATALATFEITDRHVRPWVVRDAVASHAGTFAHDAGILVTERFIGRNQVIDSMTILG